jgi:hypothetical protein
LSSDIVDAMSTVKELMLSPDGTRLELLAGALDAGAEEAGAEDDAADVEEVEDDEQPAATTAATDARATTPYRETGLNVRERGGCPPRPLLPSSIPDPFRHNALGYSYVGHRATRVSLRVER